jgi:tetraacyldisaccharide 4'-kinase
LNGVASVVCDADRLSAARWAIENLSGSLFILDDGFQHLRIARDFNLAVVDATNPWGNGRLLPAGILRERPRELARADCVLITRADDQIAADRLQSEVERLSNNRPVFRSRMTISELRQLGSAECNVTLQELKSVPLAAFCGVGNPESFFAQLRRAGFQLCHTKTFRDHHAYRQDEIEKLVNESNSRGAQVLITTAKDAVKLRTLNFALPACFVAIKIEIDEEAALINLIEKAIRR